ncbi:hypothetical protein M2305_003246 [Gluconobacter cerinus]|uniref:hypothetical protein n=1 Tax=Gluconobacter cerinus TaxID=38307 RepID=UPI001B8C5666|nr:hypothetical protein [Gluconobacter cerinus]MBS0984327.1 hypothetical protein [Gluconobacter cerinus]MCW2267227.1 hypothetical protein [Gluconobacter cerinus]
MDDLLALAAKAILAGGPLVVVCFLLGFIFFLLVNLGTANKKLDEREKKLDDLMGQSTEATKAMTEAICDLRVTISEIKGSLNAK